MKSRPAAVIFILVTLARGIVGSIRQTANHPALQSRSRIGLYRYGDGADLKLAFPRANYFRNHDFKYSDGYGLYRRRYAERKASCSVRPDRGGIRNRLYVRTCNWRISR